MQNSLPPLGALRAFEATARLGSVTAAASELSVTHGAVSRQLKTLDEHFDTALFAKAGRRLVLTHHGETLQRGLGDAFAKLRDSCAALKREVKGAPFMLACPGSLLARWLIPRLEPLRQALPALKLQVVVSDTEQPGGQTGASATLAFLEPPFSERGEVIELMAEEICAVASPAIAAELEAQPPAALFAHTLLTTASRPQAWPAWAHAQGLDTLRLDTALRQSQSFDHLYYLLEAAVAGLGVAIAPRLLVEDDIKSGRLIAPWGSVTTPARLCLWLSDAHRIEAGAGLAAWLERELKKSR